jgi:hypothetical protein
MEETKKETLFSFVQEGLNEDNNTKDIIEMEEELEELINQLPVFNDFEY